MCWYGGWQIRRPRILQSRPVSCFIFSEAIIKKYFIASLADAYNRFALRAELLFHTSVFLIKLNAVGMSEHNLLRRGIAAVRTKRNVHRLVSHRGGATIGRQKMIKSSVSASDPEFSGRNSSGYRSFLSQAFHLSVVRLPSSSRPGPSGLGLSCCASICGRSLGGRRPSYRP